MSHALPGPQRRAATPLVLFAAVATSLLVSATIVTHGPTIALGAILAPFVLFAAFIDPRVLLYTIVFCMLLSPEIVAGSAGVREVTLRAEDVLIPLALIAILARRVLRKDGALYSARLIVPIVLVTLSRIVSTGLAIHDGLVLPTAGWLFVLKTVEYFLLFYLALNGPNSKRDADRLLTAMVFTALVTAAISSSGIGSAERLSAPFEGEKPEPNTLGGYIAFMIAMVSGFAVCHPKKRVRLAALGAAALLSVPLMFTLSRSSYLAMISIGGALVLMRKRIGLAFGLLAVLVAVAVVAPDTVRERVTSTAQIVEGPFQREIALEGSAASKLNIWVWFRIAYETRPFFGWGMTGAGLVDAEYPRVFAEGGIIGLVTFLWLLFEVLRLGLDGRRSRDPTTRALATGFLAGLAALVTHAAGANTFLIVRIMEPFWFAAGLLAFRLRLERKGDGAPK